ncbi:MAG TPA: DUF309 domain-containing protein [Acidobacteriota bacterium]|jgi:predicted metal-dependent hydrolase
MRETHLQELYVKGLQLFNREQFYECHDTLEELWLEDSGSDRLFYQGLIQVAVGFYHLTGVKLGAARTMMRMALEKLAHYPPKHRGIQLAEFREQVAAWKRILDEAIALKGDVPKRSFPKIEYDPAEDSSAE